MAKRLSNREMIEALYEKFIKQVYANPFSSGAQVTNFEPVEPAKPLPPQWNLYPEEGVEYPEIEVPEGWHIEYDYANHVAGLFKTCGPIGE
jgi:hypothetical protein